jgi:hypothetical protein
MSPKAPISAFGLHKSQLFLRKVKKKGEKVLAVMKKALNLQQKSIKQQPILITLKI